MKIVALSIFGILLAASSAYAELTPDVASIRADWAKIKYQMPEDQRVEAFENLVKRAHLVSQSKANAAEPLIWEAIALASLAGEDGGLGALSKVKEARSLLERAEKLDPNSLEGSVYTSLGSLYYQVPGWPIGFGDDDKAYEYLQKALAINPHGIDSNYFYGDYLLDQGKYEEAIAAFEKVLHAPARPDRPIADAGRKKEASDAIARARKYL
ncbi:MAG: tetratricopeptide repeat protein [Gammaproteobacteria bacterium]|jgi:tetratricopeptide (TPR) repeat protein